MHVLITLSRILNQKKNSTRWKFSIKITIETKFQCNFILIPKKDTLKPLKKQKQKLLKKIVDPGFVKSCDEHKVGSFFRG